jgi:hypothetical protein
MFISRSFLKYFFNILKLYILKKNYFYINTYIKLQKQFKTNTVLPQKQRCKTNNFDLEQILKPFYKSILILYELETKFWELEHFIVAFIFFKFSCESYY